MRFPRAPICQVMRATYVRKYQRPTVIDRTRGTRPQSRMVSSWDTLPLSDLHMLVLGRIAHQAGADPEDIGAWLGLPVAVAEALCADLEAAGLLAKSSATLRSGGGSRAKTLPKRVA